MMSHTRRFSRRQALMIGVAGGAATLTACTGGGLGDGSSQSDDEGGDGSGGSLEIVWPGTSDPEIAVAEEFGAAMAEQGIEIEFNFLSWADMQQQLAVRIQANDVPDITMTQDVTDLVGLGALEPLEGYLEDSAVDTTLFSPGSLEYSTIDGKLYSLPYLAQAFTLIVNEPMLAEAGFAPEELRTWDDVVAAAAAMTDGDRYGFACPLGNPRFAFRVPLTMGYSNNLNLGDPDPAAEQRWLELLDHLVALQPYRPAADVAWDYPEMWQAFANGQVGMIVAGTYFSANVQPLNPEALETAVSMPYPAGPSGEALAPVSNAGYAIFSGSSNKELAWTVLQELASPEWTARLAAVVNTPARADVTIDDMADAVAEVYPDAVEGRLTQLENDMAVIQTSGTPLKQIVGQPEMEAEVQEVLLDLLDGSIERDEAYGLLIERLGAIADG
ncbi:ABC transporter substrate-binding protein [Actinotalea caeni]|uniref:ABC transporter substrate-binding protein n=1 Tax=Actinotalea caeni TaxID=1348467 RepID=UPI0012E31D1D|nr:extracellular solute-binding protein [Actinotalea caeni]